jgi:hypothetical protein
MEGKFNGISEIKNEGFFFSSKPIVKADPGIIQ